MNCARIGSQLLPHFSSSINQIQITHSLNAYNNVIHHTQIVLDTIVTMWNSSSFNTPEWLYKSRILYWLWKEWDMSRRIVTYIPNLTQVNHHLTVKHQLVQFSNDVIKHLVLYRSKKNHLLYWVKWLWTPPLQGHYY